MKTTTRQRLQVDDLEVGTCMTVFKNKFQSAPVDGAPESDYLKGSLLQVRAMNLPYVLVHATDPLRGRQTLAVDVRDHVFMPLSEEYAQAVIKWTPEPTEE